MLTICYYTRDTAYEEEAERLARSLQAVGMSFAMRGIEAADWYDATAYKPEFIRIMRRSYDGGLLYIDVDAFVHANCDEYFDKLAGDGVDFGAHWFQGPAGGYDKSINADRMLSGTLFIGDTAGARRLIEAWCGVNDLLRRHGCKQGGGQKNLWFLTTCLELNVERIPGRYCYVFDKPWAYPPGEPCIIEHTMASRENRGPSKDKVHDGRQRRIAELDRLLCEVNGDES